MSTDLLRRTQPAAWRALEERPSGAPQPELAASGSGQATFQLGGVFLHSAHDPAVEAWRIVSLAHLAGAPTVVIFGFGTGQIVREVLKQADPEAKVCVALLDPGSFLLALETFDLAPVLSDPRLHLAAGDLKTIAEQLPPADEQMRVVVHPPLLKAAVPSLQPLVQMAIELGATQASRLGQFDQVLANISANLPRIVRCEGVDALRRELTGQPVLLVAPGPGLEGQLETLASASRPLLVALDAAVRALLLAGIRPDLAVTIDPLGRNLAKFEGLTIDFPLVFFEGARPEMVQQSPRPVFACEQHGLLDRSHPFFGREGRFESSGTSLVAALNVLLFLDPAQIGLVGADLALTRGKSHANGPDQRLGSRKNLREVPSLGGGMTLTSETLWLHRQRFLRHAKRAVAGQIIDLRAEGAALPGLPMQELEAWLQQLTLPQNGVSISCSSQPPTGPDRYTAEDAARDAARGCAEEALRAAGFDG